GDDALKLTARAVELRPGDAGAQASHGWLLAQNGRHEEAAAAFQAALAKQPDDAEAKLGLARAWLRTGKVKEAAAELEALAAAHADSAQVWIEWGSALGKLGDTDGA